MDSGMGRIGFRKNDKGLEDIINISKLSNLKIESIFSHFSTADSKDKSYSLRQLEIYNTFLDKLQEAGVYINKKNLSNSAAIIDYQKAIMIM